MTLKNWQTDQPTYWTTEGLTQSLKIPDKPVPPNKLSVLKQLLTLCTPYRQYKELCQLFHFWIICNVWTYYFVLFLTWSEKDPVSPALIFHNMHFKLLSTRQKTFYLRTKKFERKNRVFNIWRFFGAILRFFLTKIGVFWHFFPQKNIFI